MKTAQVEINGDLINIQYTVHVNQVWIHAKGETWVYSTPKSKSRRARSGESDFDGFIRAPMPGKIVQIPVAQDQTVNSGDVLLVMEAMKMEYTLKSPVSGRVINISCQAGEQVQLEDTLIKLEAEKKS